MSNEDQSFEDYFNEIAEGAETDEDLPDANEDTEADIEADIDSDDAQSAEESEPAPEQPRDEQGRFTAADTDELSKWKAEAQQWQHRYNSDLGRQSALQKKIQEQQEELNRLRSQPQAEANPTGSGMSDSEWATLAEDFPDIARAIEARLNAVTSQYETKISQLSSQLEPIQQQARSQYVSGQYQLLEQQHPDWKDVASSNEFQSWLTTQPEPVRKLVDSEEAADAAYLISTYKLANSMNSASANDELKQRRERQLRQGQTISNRGVRPKSNMPASDDFEAAFDYFAR